MHYVLFQLFQDQKAVGVYDSRADAEEAQLEYQQKLAFESNERRIEAFNEGRGFGFRVAAKDYQNCFTIKEVVQ